MFFIKKNIISRSFTLYAVLLAICLCVTISIDAQSLTSTNPRFLSVYSLCESSNSLILPNGTCFACNFSQYPNRVTFDSCINYESWPDDKMAKDYGQRVDAGQSALLFLSTAAVCIMTFAIAFFYSGLSSDGNIMNTVLMTMMSMAITQLIWMLLGYSIAFGPGDHGWGKATWGAFANTVTRVPSGVYGHNVPHILFAMYQGMFCAVTASIISGAVVCRFSFLAYSIYVIFFTLFIYAPLARWTWSMTLSDETGEVIKNGWLARVGFLDTAGGLAVHTCGGWSALAASLMVGKRIVQSDAVPDVTRLLTSITLLWGFWFCFNGGGLGVTEIGTGAEALANTHISACAAMLVWMLAEYLYTGRASFIGAMTSAVVGLVAATPAAGYVSFIPYSIVSGGVTSFFCFLMNVVKDRYLNEYIDDTLNVWIAHGLAGFFGLLFTGIFADDDFAGGVGNGGAVSGRAALIGYQLLGAVVGAVYSFVCTAAILAVLKYTIGIRVSEEAELMGLDAAHVANQIGAYDNARAPKNEEEPFTVVICDVEKSSRLFAKDPWLMLRATEVTQKTILRLIDKYPSLYLVRREKKSRHGKSTGGSSGHHHHQRAGNGGGGGGDGDDDDDDDDEGFSSFDTRVIVSTNAAEAVRFAIEIQTELNNINWGKRVAEKLDELYIRYISGEQESILKNSRKSFRKTTTAEKFAFEQQKQLRKQPYVPYASSFNDEDDDNHDENNKRNKNSRQSKQFEESGIFANDEQNDQDQQRSSNNNKNNDNNARPSATGTSSSVSSSMNKRTVGSSNNSNVDRKNNHHHHDKTRRRDDDDDHVDDDDYEESSSRHRSRQSHRHHRAKVVHVKTTTNSQNKYQQPQRENSVSSAGRDASINSNMSLSSMPDSGAATSLYQSGASNQPVIVVTGATSASLSSRDSNTNLSNNNYRESASSELHNNNKNDASNKTDDTCTNYTNNSHYTDNTTSGGRSEAMKSNNNTSGDINANLNNQQNSGLTIAPSNFSSSLTTGGAAKGPENATSASSTTSTITETLTSADKDRNIEIIKETSQHFNGIRLRVGVHFGRGIPRFNQDTQGYEYRGVVAQVASIIRRLGHGGQSLISGIAWTQATLLDPQLKTDTIPLNLGELELTKFRGSTTLFQVLPKELVQRKFPPLRSIISDFGSSGGSGASHGGSTLSYEESDSSESPTTTTKSSSSSSSSSDRRWRGGGGGAASSRKKENDYDNNNNNNNSSTTRRKTTDNNNDGNNGSRRQSVNSSYNDNRNNNKNNNYREGSRNDEHEEKRKNVSRSSNNSYHHHHHENRRNDDDNDDEEENEDRRRGKSNTNNNNLSQNKSRSRTGNSHHNSSSKRRYDDDDDDDDDDETGNNHASSNHNQNYKEQYTRSSNNNNNNFRTSGSRVSPNENGKNSNNNNNDANNPLSTFASQSKKQQTQQVSRGTSNLSKKMVFPEHHNGSSGAHTSTSQQRQQRQQQQQHNINHDSTVVLTGGVTPGNRIGSGGSSFQQMNFQNSEPLQSGVVPNIEDINKNNNNNANHQNLPKVVSVDDLLGDAADIREKNPSAPGGTQNRRTRGQGGGGGGTFKTIGVVPHQPQQPHPLDNSGLKSLELNNLGVTSRSDTGLGYRNENHPRNRFGKRAANNNNNNNNYSSFDEEASCEGATDFYGKNQVLGGKTKTDNNNKNKNNQNRHPSDGAKDAPKAPAGAWTDDYTDYSNGDNSETNTSDQSNNNNNNKNNNDSNNENKVHTNNNDNINIVNFPHTQQALNQQNQSENANGKINNNKNNKEKSGQQQPPGTPFSTTKFKNNNRNKAAEVIDLDDVESETDRNNIASSQIASSMQAKFVLHQDRRRLVMNNNNNNNNGNNDEGSSNLIGSSATFGVDVGGGAEFSLNHVHEHGTPNGSHFSSSAVRQPTTKGLHQHQGRRDETGKKTKRNNDDNKKNNNGRKDNNDADDDADDGKFGETHTSDEDNEDEEEFYDYTKIRPEKEKQKTSHSSGRSSSRSSKKGKSKNNSGRKKNQKYYSKHSDDDDDDDDDMDEYGYKDEFVAANDFERLRKQAKVKKQQQQNSPKYGRRKGNDNNQKFVDEDDDDEDEDEDYYRQQRQRQRQQEKMKKKKNQNKYDFDEQLVEYQI